MTYAAPLHSNGSATGAQLWLRESVRSFFEAIPWEGRSAIAPPRSAPAGQSAAESPLTMSVGLFFETFPWEGKPTIAVPVAPLEMQPEENLSDNDAFTLDAFSDLF